MILLLISSVLKKYVHPTLRPDWLFIDLGLRLQQANTFLCGVPLIRFIIAVGALGHVWVGLLNFVNQNSQVCCSAFFRHCLYGKAVCWQVFPRILTGLPTDPFRFMKTCVPKLSHTACLGVLYGLTLVLRFSWINRWKTNKQNEWYR